MLTKTRQLVEELNRNNIIYCHWKSNLALDKALEGDTDVDLLVQRRDISRFREILAQLRFKLALNKEGEAYPSVEHHFALDEESGVLVHVHSYYRVITGESLAKNYRLPVEAMLLENTRTVNTVRVPTKGAELVIFTIRIMLKHTSLVELVMLSRDRQQVEREIAWLATADTIDEALQLVACWLPALNPALFADCVNALNASASLVRRISLGLQLRSQLRMYTRKAGWRARLSGAQKFSAMLWRRLTRSPKAMNPAAGGAVIALVGPEATGKSTLLGETNHWLGEYFATERFHAGKPQSTLLTFIPNLAVPALRALLPAQRPSKVEQRRSANMEAVQSEAMFPLLASIRSVLLGYDRRALLTRAFRDAANGKIVLCDRYPSSRTGAPDSPQLVHSSLSPDRYPVRRWLARLEQRLYSEIPPPDLIISLSAPVEVAVLRNTNRGKNEPEDYVRLRHAQSSNLTFGRAPLCQVDTNQPLEKTVLEVKKAVWDVL